MFIFDIQKYIRNILLKNGTNSENGLELSHVRNNPHFDQKTCPIL